MNPDDVLGELSDAQREAVCHGDGPLLIIAGAGTGKTTVLTRRIAHLIRSQRARPEQILALTFTEKAAVEMAERVDQLIPYGYAETRIGTFHAFGDRVLREGALETGLDPGFRVLSRPEQVIFLRERLFQLPLSRFRPLGDPTRHLDALLTLVSRAKDEDVSPEEYLAFAERQQAGAAGPEEQDAAEREREVAAFYGRYQELLIEAGLIDFGDQIFRALRLLRDRPATLARLRDRFRFILVDEFQDTNRAQLELVRLLAGEGSNITVVGDDDQAIYRWRGAASANLLTFRQLYPGAHEVLLTENHRSTQVILDAAARLISYNNPYRLEVVANIDKRLHSSRKEGRAVRHLHYDTVSAESDGVAGLIAERLGQGYRPRDCAILVRSNGDADPFQRALNVRGIPHRFSGSRGLYAREEVRLLVAFLRVLAHPEDSISLFYLAASEVYHLPEIDLLRLASYARRKTRPLLEVFRDLPTNEDLAGVGGKAREAAARVVADLARTAEEVPRRRTGEVLYGYLQSTGMLGDLSREASVVAETKVKNIARFFDIVRAYGDVAAHDRVPEFVSHLDLLREAGDNPAVAEADIDEDAVQVLTAHKAKGLEFPVVFLVGCAEQKFPISGRRDPLELPAELAKDPPAGGDAHLMEERRLFYVAMTRARDELLLTSAADYGTARTRKVSRFVVEALDLPSPSPAPRRTSALEAIARAGASAAAAEAGPAAEEQSEQPVRLSFAQMDDYLTCPLKYRYVHILRVPLLTHHRVVYGHAIHEAVQRHFKARMLGRRFSENDLVAAFHAAWISEGFLSREHEIERLRTGETTLRRFHRQEAERPLRPTAVEKEFAFFVGAAKVIGRYDLVVEEAGVVTILDFKTGAVREQKRADERAHKSLQLDIYALAHLRATGELPGRVELHFLESGLVGGKVPSAEEAEHTAARIRDVAAALRRREFPPQPQWQACSQCAFRDICPYTAWRGTEE